MEETKLETDIRTMLSSCSRRCRGEWTIEFSVWVLSINIILYFYATYDNQMENEKDDEQLSLRVEGPKYKLFKLYFPYAIIIAMGGYIVHLEARNVTLTTQTIELLKIDIEFKRKSLESWKEADENTRAILLEMIKNKS